MYNIYIYEIINNYYNIIFMMHQHCVNYSSPQFLGNVFCKYAKSRYMSGSSVTTTFWKNIIVLVIYSTCTYYSLFIIVNSFCHCLHTQTEIVQ